MTVIHKSPLPDVDIADVSITDYVLRKADEVSDKPAFIDGATGRIITFAELKDQIRRFAGALSNRGFSVGSTLALGPALAQRWRSTRALGLVLAMALIGRWA